MAAKPLKDKEPAPPGFASYVTDVDSSSDGDTAEPLQQRMWKGWYAPDMQAQIGSATWRDVHGAMHVVTYVGDFPPSRFPRAMCVSDQLVTPVGRGTSGLFEPFLYTASSNMALPLVALQFQPIDMDKLRIGINDTFAAGDDADLYS